MKTEDYREQAIEDLIKFSVQEAANELLDELPPPEEVEFSKEHEAKMQELFKTVGKKAKAKTKIRRIKPRWRVAIAVAIILGITIGSVMCIEALRVKIQNFMINFTSTNTEIRYVDEDKENNSYSVDDVTFGYFPEGFELAETKNINGKIYIDFNRDSKFFSFQVSRLKITTNVDTEEVGTKLTKINNFDAHIAEKEGITSIIWSDNYMTFELSGNIEKIELIKIAENIIIKQN